MENKKPSPEVVISVDFSLEPFEIETRWKSRDITRHGEVTGSVLVIEKPIEKRLGVAHAKNVVRHLQDRLDFYYSDYHQWSRRKCGR